MTNTTITNVKLVNSGLKGVEVKYLAHEKIEERSYFNEYLVKRKAPIHSELEKTFSWLKGHLLDICGYSMDKDVRDYHMGTLSMEGIFYDKSKGFILIGSLPVMDGSKSINLTTPLTTADDYPEYNNVCSIIDAVFTETQMYLNFKKVMDDVELVMKFNKKNDNFDPEAFKKLTKQEQRDFATKILEDQKCVVIHTDLEDDTPKTMDDFSTEYIPEEDFTHEEEPEQETSVDIIEEDDDFSLDIKIPVAQKSTAKRK